MVGSDQFHRGEAGQVDKQPVSFTAGVRYCAESPDSGPDGLGFRGVVTFLFPK
jgi:hypothetical protein